MKLEPYKHIDENIKYWGNLWLNELKSLHKSEHTLKSYKNILNSFIEFCYLERVEEEKLSIKDINRYFINSYLSFLTSSVNTKAYYLRVLKSFFRYISENNEDLVDVLEKVEKIKLKTKKKEVVIFNDFEFNRIKKELLKRIKSKDYSRQKNAFLILFIMLTGMRAGEAIKLLYENIEFDDEVIKIKIIGKGNKERYNYIKIEEFKKEWLDFLRKRPAGQYLFCKKNGDILDYTTLLKYNHHLLDKLFISKHKRGLHIYRHSFATRMVEKGVNLEVVKEWLGHSSIMITSQFYLKVGEQVKKELAYKI